MPAAYPRDKCRAAAIPTASTSTSLSHLEQLSGEELAAMASILLEALGDLQDLPPSSRLIASTLVQALHLASTFSSREEGVSRVTDMLGRTVCPAQAGCTAATDCRTIRKVTCLCLTNPPINGNVFKTLINY